MKILNINKTKKESKSDTKLFNSLVDDRGWKYITDILNVLPSGEKSNTVRVKLKGIYKNKEILVPADLIAKVNSPLKGKRNCYEVQYYASNVVSEMILKEAFKG